MMTGKRKWWPAYLCVILSVALHFASCTPKQSQRALPPPPANDENRLTVGISANAPPLVYKQGDRIVGLEPEMAKEFGTYIGKPVQLVELPWADQIPALLEGRIDIIMSGMSVTPMREVRIAFSKPYFITGQMALVRKTDRDNFPTAYVAILTQSVIMRIGAVKGTTGQSFVENNFGQAKQLVFYDTSGPAVNDLISKKIDVFIHDGPMILMLAAENQANGLSPLPELMSEEYLAWGIRKDNVELLRSANSFLDRIKTEGKLAEMVKRWIPFQE